MEDLPLERMKTDKHEMARMWNVIPDQYEAILLNLNMDSLYTKL